MKINYTSCKTIVIVLSNMYIRCFCFNTTILPILLLGNYYTAKTITYGDGHNIFIKLKHLFYHIILIHNKFITD